MNIPISANYKRLIIQSILSITLFILTYLLFIGLAIAIALSCMIATYEVVTFCPGLGAIIVAMAVLCVGSLVVFTLLRFLFEKHHNCLAPLLLSPSLCKCLLYT